MDRLSIIVIALVAACDDKPKEPLPSRVNGAKTAQAGDKSSASFCDVHYTADKAPAFAWPALTAAAPGASSKWRWINVWASYCKPCLEEMPRLQRWRGKLGVDLVLVSIDESGAEVDAFKKEHPETPPTLRLADAKAQPAWFKSLGLDAGAPIPVNVFVDPAGKIRCARSAEVRDTDYASVERLLRE